MIQYGKTCHTDGGTPCKATTEAYPRVSENSNKGGGAEDAKTKSIEAGQKKVFHQILKRLRPCQPS